MSNERDYMPNITSTDPMKKNAEYHDMVMNLASVLANLCESGMDISIYVSNPNRVVLPWPSIYRNPAIGWKHHDVTQRIHMIADSQQTLYMLRRLDKMLNEIRIATLDPCAGLSQVIAGDPFIMNDRISGHAARSIVKKMRIKKKSIRKATERQIAALIRLMIMRSNKELQEVRNQYSNILGVLGTIISNTMGHPGLMDDDGYGYDPDDDDGDDTDTGDDTEYDDPFQEAREALAANAQGQEEYKDTVDMPGDTSDTPAFDADVNPIPNGIPTPSGHGFNLGMLANLYGVMGSMGGLGGLGAALRGMVDDGNFVAGIMHPDRMDLDNIMAMPAMAALDEQEQKNVRKCLPEVLKQLDSMGYQMTKDVAESVAGVIKDLDPGEPNASEESSDQASEEIASDHPTEDVGDSDAVSCNGESCPTPNVAPNPEDK